MGVFNCIDAPHNPTVGYTVKSIGYSELNALNPTNQVDIIISELEESNKEIYKLDVVGYDFEEDYLDIPRATDRRKAMRENPYFNAIQVKYGYALTCHKTQGGQWRNVFVEDMNKIFAINPL